MRSIGYREGAASTNTGLAESPLTRRLRYRFVSDLSPQAGRGEVRQRDRHHALPRPSLNRSSFCCTGRSEKLNSTESASASWVTHCQLGTTNRSRGSHSKV